MRWSSGWWSFLVVGLGVGLVGVVPLRTAAVLNLPDQIRPAPVCFDNANRYVDCGNGTVTDTVTGLIWLANANCFGTETYADANTMAAGLADGQCGLSDGSFAGDWRLATEAEWQATVARAVALGCTNVGASDPPSLTDTAMRSC